MGYSPMRARKMSGEAWTAGRSGTFQFLLEAIDVDGEDIDLLASQGQQEISAVQLDFCSSLPVVKTVV